jgi:hypothetical protein
MQRTCNLYNLGFIQTSVIHWSRSKEKSHLDGHGVGVKSFDDGEHETGGGGSDAEDLGGATVAEAEADGGVEGGGLKQV